MSIKYQSYPQTKDQIDVAHIFVPGLLALE